MLGVKYLSVWGFSTENWKRDKKERDALFDIILKDIQSFRKDEEKNKIRMIHYGRKDRIPEALRKEIEMLEKETGKNTKITLILCIDYGGRDEIVRAVNKILKSGKKEVNEKEFSEYLDTKGIREPDLVIRTAGELRTSGFMPFQSAYAELYFVKK
jgi:undecaprenyl diphosphate synthase